MIPDLAATRHASVLIGESRDGVLRPERFSALVELAKVNPVRVAAIAAQLAVSCAAATVPVDLADEVHLRAAHAAFRRGENAPWVTKGEREYQRVMKARRRKRGTP